MLRRLTLVKPLQKGLGCPLRVIIQKDTIHLVSHLPPVHRLLVLLARLQDEHVDRLGVRDVSVRLELLAEAVAEVGWGEVECVEVDDFGSLCVCL